MRRKILFGRLDHLLTLTHRENLEDRERADANLSLFLERVKAENPDWKYLAVPERQKRGSIHYHLAVHGWQDVRMLRRIWWGIVGEANGNIDVRSPQKGGGGKVRWGRVNLARYMAKYIGKDLSLYEMNKKNYWHSKNVLDPVVQRVNFTNRVDIVARVSEFIVASGGRVKKIWESESGSFGWISTF
jgi:hypothetical protein